MVVLAQIMDYHTDNQSRLSRRSRRLGDLDLDRDLCRLRCLGERDLERDLDLERDRRRWRRGLGLQKKKK